ncbi:MAG: putative toxin-antitoxin system toxin component, PIN family [Candidatus Aminicenantes bacterium]|nr:putative toxin-antitoxin system toxin component, PIN family [Candidatus Aminicenantes bacterium]
MNRSRPLRLVLDTNVFVSAVLFGGKPGRILFGAREGNFRLLLSAPVLKEYVTVLAYPKFDLAAGDIRRLVREDLIPWSEPVQVATKVRFIPEDPSDDKFLALAVDGKADMVISGDRHLLGAKMFRDIPILSVDEFLTEPRR